MINDVKQLPVISRCQNITGKADTIFEDLNSIQLGDAKIYDFGSKSSFFCIISDKADELKFLSNEILDYLCGDYVLIDIYKHTAPHICIGISYACLRDYIPSIFQLKDKKIEEVLKKIKIEFTSKFSLFSFKYLEFHKDYNKSTFKFLFLQAYCLQFICDFLSYLEVEQHDKRIRAQSLDTKKIKEILQKVISELYKTSPSVQEMASMADMSLSKFKVLFNNEFGESPHQHILGKKLILARELLRTGSYSVSQVSYKVGFNHPSGFTRLFRHKFQCSPSEIIVSN
jgi:AraC-like DNA-binding protein